MTMFEGHVDSPKRTNLLYDDVERYYQVILNITCAMAKKYVCKARKNACKTDATNRCDQTTSDSMAMPKCTLSAVRIPCAECNRHFRNQTFFAKHKHSASNKKSIYERKRCCSTCGALIRGVTNDCNKRYCKKCKQNREVGHLYYMRPLKDIYMLTQTRNCTYFMISRIHKISGIPIIQYHMCLNSSECNSILRGVRKSKTV